LKNHFSSNSYQFLQRNYKAFLKLIFLNLSWFTVTGKKLIDTIFLRQCWVKFYQEVLEFNPTTFWSPARWCPIRSRERINILCFHPCRLGRQNSGSLFMHGFSCCGFCSWQKVKFIFWFWVVYWLCKINKKDFRESVQAGHPRNIALSLFSISIIRPLITLLLAIC